MAYCTSYTATRLNAKYSNINILSILYLFRHLNASSAIYSHEII